MTQPLPIVDEPARRCGKCCLQVGRPPFVARLQTDVTPARVLLKENELPRNMPPALIAEVEQYLSDVLERQTPDRLAERLPCSWLDLSTMLCRHYEFRPKRCREFDCSESGLECTALT